MASLYEIGKATLCLVVGVPASGKTVLAQGLARAIDNACYVSKDLIQSAFTRQERVTGEVYSFIQGPTFHILVSYAELQLGLCKTPIIDAPFSINHLRNDECRDWVSPFRMAAQAHKARLAIIRCLPPGEEALRQRILQRGYAWDEWKLRHWEEFLRQEPLRFPIAHNDVFEIISDRPLEQTVENILTNYLAAVKRVIEP